MNAVLVKALVGLLPVAMLLFGSLVSFAREKRVLFLLQLLGAAGLVIVVLAHICEALQLFLWMDWGREHSVGHYLDLSGAVLGVSLFPLGYLLDALTRRRRLAK